MMNFSSGSFLLPEVEIQNSSVISAFQKFLLPFALIRISHCFLCAQAASLGVGFTAIFLPKSAIYIPSFCN